MLSVLLKFIENPFFGRRDHDKKLKLNSYKSGLLEVHERVLNTEVSYKAQQTSLAQYGFSRSGPSVLLAHSAVNRETRRKSAFKTFLYKTISESRYKR